MLHTEIKVGLEFLLLFRTNIVQWLLTKVFDHLDVYLTKNPNVTFFKSAFKRYSMFQKESVALSANGNPAFGRKITVPIVRSGDLVGKCYVEMTLPPLIAPDNMHIAWTKYVGLALLDYVEFSIGGSKIDKHYSTWLIIMHELYQSKSNEEGMNEMIGNVDELTVPAPSTPEYTVIVPLQFYFNRFYKQALPLVALQYHPCQFDIQFKRAEELYTIYDVSGSSPVPTSKTLPISPILGAVNVWCEYIYLDDDERETISNEAADIVFEQLQFNSPETYSGQSVKSRLAFNHPVSEIFFLIQLASNLDNGANRWADFSMSGTDSSKAYRGGQPLKEATLMLNGNERFARRNAMYFNRVVPAECHTRTPAQGIYCYSFANKPEEAQPSGTLNFSRIDTANLSLETRTGNQSYNLLTFALSKNVLRIKNGLGGVAFSS